MATALFRTIILYFLIMAGLRLMGKRQIGELEPNELVLTMMVSDLATVPMQDFGSPGKQRPALHPSAGGPATHHSRPAQQIGRGRCVPPHSTHQRRPGHPSEPA